MNGYTDLRKLRDVQRKVAKEANLAYGIKTSEVKRIAGFDLAFLQDKCVCAAVVLEYPSMKVLERKSIVMKVPMNYIPGYLAFREGPPIITLYYDIEEEPDVLMVDGHGIAHPLMCGLATYVGVELGKPCIGVAKNLLIGSEKDGNIVVGDEVIGVVVRTKEHARPLYVSQGNLVTLEAAKEIVEKCVIPPHKLPEPLHQAHRLSKRELYAKLFADKPVMQESVGESAAEMAS